MPYFYLDENDAQFTQMKRIWFMSDAKTKLKKSVFSFISLEVKKRERNSDEIQEAALMKWHHTKP